MWGVFFYPRRGGSAFVIITVVLLAFRALSFFFSFDSVFVFRLW
jgi:hypothetical protein